MSIPSIDFNHQKSNQAELEIISLSSIYDREFAAHDPQSPHRVSFFLLIYFEQGQGTHMVDFIDYPYSAGSVIFVQQDQVHAFDFSSKPEGKILLFTQAFLDQIHTNMRLPNYTPTHLNQQHNPLVVLDNSDASRILMLINDIELEIAMSKTDPLIVMYLFSAMALMLHRLRPELKHDKLSASQSVKLGQFFGSLQSHFQTRRDANWYASQLHTTYKSLNEICKLATGLTAKQMIDSFTIIEIKRRLVTSGISTQTLAYDFGFEDSSNFVKYFKNQTSLTPSQFKQHYAQPRLHAHH